ncbi:hypothetical protein I3842_08G130400 [Carya illinoinensis]|uniref:Uncharacterized protein n=1 Tax=Carya illinoinensis TaxID=32201 RepID=A0A922JAU4_CARIL|nr:hypothetical protein I3842_08G130400 [Carya illinoinensis]
MVWLMLLSVSWSRSIIHLKTIGSGNAFTWMFMGSKTHSHWILLTRQFLFILFLLTNFTPIFTSVKD